MGKCCNARVVGVVERAIKKGFDRYAKLVADYPLPFLLVPIVITGCLLAGLARFNYVSDSEYLYTPIDGTAKNEKRVMKRNFPTDEENLFISTRKVDFDGFLQVILTSSNNVYTETGVDAAILVDNTVKNFLTTGRRDDISLQDVCSKWNGTCEENHFLELVNFDAANVASASIQYPINNGVFLGHELGGVKTDSSDTITEAKAIMLSYHVQYLDNSINKRSQIWLDEIKDELFDLDINNIKLVLQTSQSLDQELDKATLEIIPLFSATYTILCTFSVLTCVMFDWVRSKMWIALAGQVSAALAIASAIGLVSAAGVPFASICSTMPFLLMGIGIDDMFVIVAAWRDTPVRHSVRHRMGQTFSHAAVSITLTSVTDCLAFGIGAISPFRSVNFFCAYAGTACAFCYIYAITFLAACMVYSGKLEERNRHIATCMRIDPERAAEQIDEPMSVKKFCCWGSAVQHDDSDVTSAEVKVKPAPEEVNHTMNSDTIKDNDPIDQEKGARSIPEVVVPYAVRLIGYPYAHYILTPVGKISVLVSYLLYVAVGIYGCTQLQQGLELQNLAPDNSYLADFYEEFNQYFYSKYSGQVMVAMTESLDYTSTSDLDKIDDLVDSFQKDKHFFSNDDFVQFWLYDYQDFITNNGLVVNSMADFIHNLQNVFLPISGYDRYEVDIEFSGDNSEITASRFTIQAKGVECTTEESDLMLRSRELVARSKLRATAYFSAFIYWDQYIVILQVTLINLGIAVISCLVASFLLVPSIVAVLMVGVAISSICVGVVGFMALWDVSLDSISMINLVLCIGFSVDFSAHICYHFSAVKNEDNPTETTPDSESATADGPGGAVIQGTENEKGETFKYSDGNFKARTALIQLGLPIIQGALSTILAVSILSASNTYIFRTFFKVIFLVMCFGFYHSMMILPVVLSFFGDLNCCRKSKKVGIN